MNELIDRYFENTTQVIVQIIKQADVKKNLKATYPVVP